MVKFPHVFGFFHSLIKAPYYLFMEQVFSNWSPFFQFCSLDTSLQIRTLENTHNNKTPTCWLCYFPTQTSCLTAENWLVHASPNYRRIKCRSDCTAYSEIKDSGKCHLSAFGTSVLLHFCHSSSSSRPQKYLLRLC